MFADQKYNPGFSGLHFPGLEKHLNHDKFPSMDIH